MTDENQPWSGVRTGPLRNGEWVTVTDPKGKRKSLLLQSGHTYHTTKGGVPHDEIIGGPDGNTVITAGGMGLLVLRPLLSDYTVTMPRGAAIIYPKEAGQIVMAADIFPGARVIEAGVGSGGLTLSLLRAIGPEGQLHSFERRPDFAEIARSNVRTWLGADHPGWQIHVGDLVEQLAAEPENPAEVDRVILDMLAPWDCIEAVRDRLAPGGVLCCYVATTTQLGRVMDTIRTVTGFTEPQGTETMTRDWHAEGLAIRPAHGTGSHTGFLVTARRLAPGVVAPMRKRRPAAGAYGPDYTGPRPAWVPTLDEVRTDTDPTTDWGRLG